MHDNKPLQGVLEHGISKEKRVLISFNFKEGDESLSEETELTVQRLVFICSLIVNNGSRQLVLLLARS